MSEAGISKLRKAQTPHSSQSKTGNEENDGNPAVGGRPGVNAVPGGIKVGGPTDNVSATSISTPSPVVTSAPQFTGPAPQHGSSQAKNASPSSSVSSSAQTTLERTSMDGLDFSQPDAVRMMEQAAAQGNIRDLANMIKQGAAEHVSAECRNVLMARLVDEPILKADEQISLVQTLLKAGADASGIHKGTPHIVSAARWGRADLVMLLVKYGADINAADEQGYTALMMFARYHNDDIGQRGITKLQAAKPDVSMVNKHEQSALLIAAERGNPKCLQTLLQLVPKLDQSDARHQALLKAAIYSNDMDTVRVASGMQVELDQRDRKRETALFHSLDKKAAEIASTLLKDGSDVNKRFNKGETRLAIACRLGMPADVIKALLSVGADPDMKDNKGRTPLSRAKKEMRDEYERVFKEFDSMKTDTAEHVRNASVGGQRKNHDRKIFLDAIASNNILGVLAVLQHDAADINAPDENGITPLMHTCNAKCSESMIKLLLKLGADLEQKDSEGRSAIFWVPEARRTEYEYFFTKHYIDSL